jgi:hypothetical protein
LPETNDSRPGRDRREGRSGTRRPIVAMVFSPLPRREEEAHARRRAATRGAAIISDEDVRGSSWGLDDLGEGVFACPPPPVQLRHDRSRT